MDTKLLDVFERIRQLGEHEACQWPIDRSLAYITEELGEYAKAILEREPIENVREEAVDIVVAALGNFYALGGNFEEFLEVANRKAAKWEKNINVQTNQEQAVANDTSGSNCVCCDSVDLIDTDRWCGG